MERARRSATSCEPRASTEAIGESRTLLTDPSRLSVSGIVVPIWDRGGRERIVSKAAVDRDRLRRHLARSGERPAETASAIGFRHGDAEPASLGYRLREAAVVVPSKPVLIAKAAHRRDNAVLISCCSGVSEGHRPAGIGCYGFGSAPAYTKTRLPPWRVPQLAVDQRSSSDARPGGAHRFIEKGCSRARSPVISLQCR